MRYSRSRRKSRLGAVLSTARRALVWGVLIFIALKADALKRLLALYQAWSSPSGQPTGGAETSKVGTPSAAADSDVQNENAVSSVAGKQNDDDTGTGDPSVTSGSGDTGVATSGDTGSIDAPDAQGLILMDEVGIGDQDSGDVGALGTREAPPNDIDDGLAARRDVAELLQSTADDSARPSGGSGRAPSGEDAEDTLEMVMADRDAIPGDGTTECPEGFPIKGNDRSQLYHVPEGLAYARTKPDMCFRTPEAAEKAGFRRATG